MAEGETNPETGESVVEVPPEITGGTEGDSGDKTTPAPASPDDKTLPAKDELDVADNKDAGGTPDSPHRDVLRG